MNAKTIVGLIVFCFVFVSSAFAVDVLTGKTFAGSMTKQGTTTGDPDNFIFKEGKFRSTACDQYGFKEGVYSATTKGAATAFEALTMNDEGTRISWKGIVEGGKLTGTATMTTAAREVTSYSFDGNLRTAH